MALTDKLENMTATNAAAQSMEGLIDPSTDLAPAEFTKIISDHLSSLSDPEKEFIAAFMTPEFAQAVGILTGSEELYSFLSERADASRTLFPMAKADAQQLLASIQGQTETAVEAPSMTEATTPPEDPEMMLPQGAMSPV